jgi:hypothetical protein
MKYHEENNQTIVYDKEGMEIKAGQKVLVHQDNGQLIREAIVVETYPNKPTLNQSGHWINLKIEKQDAEEMPSYLLKVIDNDATN